MAEIVEYRVSKTLDELELLVDFGLLNEKQAHEITKKRQDFEYTLRRRTRTKLDFLKYIKYEANLLESVDKYKKTVLETCMNADKTSDKITEIDRKILVLQAKKLNDIIRARCAHISSLFRKLTTSYQFDKRLWIAYIEFAKSRKFNTRVSSLYWRLLRVANDDVQIWIEAASHEIEVNKAFDTARGLFLRALRHHPKSALVWAEYFKMEMRFMDIVDRRAQVVCRTVGAMKVKDDEAAVWDDDLDEQDEADGDNKSKDSPTGPQPMAAETNVNEDDAVPSVKPIDKDDEIISGRLPKVVYEKATDVLDNDKDLNAFLVRILRALLDPGNESVSVSSLRQHVCGDIKARSLVSKNFAKNCDSLAHIEKFDAAKNIPSISPVPKRLKMNS